VSNRLSVFLMLALTGQMANANPYSVEQRTTRHGT